MQPIGGNPKGEYGACGYANNSKQDCGQKRFFLYQMIFEVQNQGNDGNWQEEKEIRSLRLKLVNAGDGSQIHQQDEAAAEAESSGNTGKETYNDGKYHFIKSLTADRTIIPPKIRRSR